jgi:hypothetical protein
MSEIDPKILELAKRDFGENCEISKRRNPSLVCKGFPVAPVCFDSCRSDTIPLDCPSQQRWAGRRR